MICLILIERNDSSRGILKVNKAKDLRTNQVRMVKVKMDRMDRTSSKVKTVKVRAKVKIKVSNSKDRTKARVRDKVKVNSKVRLQVKQAMDQAWEEVICLV